MRNEILFYTCFFHTYRFDFVVIGAAFIMGIVEAVVADGKSVSITLTVENPIWLINCLSVQL